MRKCEFLVRLELSEVNRILAALPETRSGELRLPAAIEQIVRNFLDAQEVSK